MNALTSYHSPDAILTESLVHESSARAASLKSVTLRNVLFGTAALTGALLLGWAAIKWADAQKLDPKLLQEALANMPELKVAPVQIAKDATVGVKDNAVVGVRDGAAVGIKPGSEIGIAPGEEVGVHGTLGLDPNATVTVKGTVKQGSSTPTPLPDMSKQPTKTDAGDAIKREVVVFTEVPWNGGTVVSGWRYRSGSSKQPYLQYCYYSTSPDTGITENVVYLIRDGTDSLVPRNVPFNAAEARSKCVKWRG